MKQEDFFSEESLKSLRENARGGCEKSAKVLLEIEKELRKRRFREQLLNEEA